MKARLFSLAALAFFAIALPPSAWAAAGYYLKIPDIDGESTNQVYKDHIEVLAFNFGMSNSTTVSGGGTSAGRVRFQDISFTKALDKSTPKLMFACATGQLLSQVELFLTKPDPKGGGGTVVYMKIILKDVLVTSYQTGGNSGGIPTDSFSLNFGEIQLEYTPFDSKNDPLPAVVFTFDLETVEA